ncbi:hypothetical protein MMC18_006080 [Xylographa bjoerkii]|nr:hypothetical protein [Xylographa bjoerkii]
MGRKDSDVVSEHRDSRDMGESSYNGAPPKRHDRYILADLGAHDMDFDLGMALYVDKRGIEGLAKIGKRMEEDEKEEPQEVEEEPLEEEGDEAAEQVEEEAVEDKSEEPQVEHYEEVNFFNSEQSWNWWGKEVPDETVKTKERKEQANAGHEASFADRLLAAWTTVKPVICGGDGEVGDAGN